MEKNCLFYLILLNIFSSFALVIIIPFQTYNPLITKNETLLQLIKNASDKSIVDTLSHNLIYTEFNVGENIQTVPSFIEMRTQDFEIKDIIIKEKTNTPQIKNSNFTFGENYLLRPMFKMKYYNSEKSISYKFVKDCYNFLFGLFLIKNSCGNETIYMVKKNNINEESKVSPIKFYITFKKFEYHDQRPAIIGLNYFSHFISNLKENSDINGSDFSFKYTNSQEDKGELIIGDLPYVYDVNHYEESNLRSAKVIKEPIIKWTLNFDIFISPQNKKKKEYHLQIDEIAYFYIEEFFITASQKYFNYIEENFFDKYIDKKICKKHIHNKAYYEENYFHIICDIENKNERKKFFDEFPNLILYQKEMNYNFTLNSTDLFTIIPDGKRILFNIDFTFNSNKWILGKPFFKKFQLFFNSDTNLISYFIPPKNLENNVEIGSNKGNGLKIFLIIFLTCLAFALGIIFGRALCSKYNRKIRANELEDNYSYISNDKNKINNKDVSDNFDLNNKNNNIEDFKSKYYNLT